MLGFLDVISKIEDELCSFYDFPLKANVKDHLIEKGHVEQINQGKPYSNRAGVFLVEEDKQECFIGVYFNEKIKSHLKKYDPTTVLSHLNLDAFCVLVEEISHFHLIINRASEDRSVSKLELEYQGEIDKLLFSGLFLEKQCGDHHAEVLFKKIFEKASFHSHEFDLYWQASKLAAKFWQVFLEKAGVYQKSILKSQALRNHMQRNYKLPLADKVLLSNSQRVLAAA